jgi:hypothetical protein
MERDDWPEIYEKVGEHKNCTAILSQDAKGYAGV